MLCSRLRIMHCSKVTPIPVRSFALLQLMKRHPFNLQQICGKGRENCHKSLQASITPSSYFTKVHLALEDFGRSLLQFPLYEATKSMWPPSQFTDANSIQFFVRVFLTARRNPFVFLNGCKWLKPRPQPKQTPPNLKHFDPIVILPSSPPPPP